MVALVIIVAIVVLFEAAVWFLGADSRDGADWKPAPLDAPTRR